MLLSLAWKNIWRNKKRSLIIVVAIAFGLWGGLFSDAMMVGMSESIVETAINRDLAHIQIHQSHFTKDKDIKEFIPDGPGLVGKIRSLSGIKGVSGRTVIQGMASSPTSSFGVNIFAIQPQQERQTTRMFQKMKQGAYFGSELQNPIIIGRRLANRLNLKLHKKIVLSFEDLNGDITYMACRIVGIFQTASSNFDELTVFLRQKDLFATLDGKPFIHEIAIRLQNSSLIPAVQKQLKDRYPKLQIQNWKEIAPELSFLSETMDLYSYVFVGIILLALLFGITNTMLMSVVERTREFGILLAIGMKKVRVVSMLILETVLLSFTGGLAGILISYLTIALTGHSGIDFSFYAASLQSFGSSSILYPTLPLAMYLILTVMILIAANLAALYPAWKATHLLPAEAIRSF